MIMRTGDLKPDLRITLSDPDSGVDTTGATIRIIGARGRTKVFDRSPTTTNVTGSGADTVTELTMLWEAGDTTTVGKIDIEVEVTWPGTKPQSFPLVSVQVKEDLDLRTAP